MRDMTFNDTAAAYGLFQVVFADVANHLAVATYHLRKLREPNLAFEEVFGLEVSRVRDQFKDELKRFDGRDSVKENLYDLREACKTISALMKWRNDRIHARVVMTESGYALYDWRTGQRLEIHRDVIVEGIQSGIKVIGTLGVNVRPLVGQFELEEELEKLFKSMPDLSEPEDDDADSATA
jgi:hypothetical protein